MVSAEKHDFYGAKQKFGVLEDLWLKGNRKPRLGLALFILAHKVWLWVMGRSEIKIIDVFCSIVSIKSNHMFLYA